MNLTDIQVAFLELLMLASGRLFLKKAVLTKPTDVRLLRANAKLFSKDGRPCLQFEILQKDNKAIHKNIAIDNMTALGEFIFDYMQIDLVGDGAEAEYRRSKSGNEIILGQNKFYSALQNYHKKIEIAAHNRKKSYTLDGSEPFLFALGISDKNGRVHDKKQAKFRQINRFVEHLADVCKELPDDCPLNVLDLCCGKSYLTFAVYHYLTAVLHREVSMIGIDLKEDAIAFCSETASALGCDGLRFYAADINDFSYPSPVHLVISLHACDVATDIVLSKAIALGAKVILSTPCCQKELLQNLNTAQFEFVTRYPILKKKLCDALTDAMRLARLEANGYEVTAIEFTDPEDTPKNILLRAVLKHRPDKQKLEEYDRLCTSLVGDKPLYLKGI
ncbi:MAG: SAM-dependent methyltransferase [Clostridia bacterium]|nr:SAM-dependent methyltransferase [Clostridia bacterium]